MDVKFLLFLSRTRSVFFCKMLEKICGQSAVTAAKTYPVSRCRKQPTSKSDEKAIVSTPSCQHKTPKTAGIKIINHDKCIRLTGAIHKVSAYHNNIVPGVNTRNVISLTGSTIFYSLNNYQAYNK